MTKARDQNPSFRSKKWIIRELDRPFETAPETTRESTSTMSRIARIPSRVMRLRRLTRLSSSKRLTCLPTKNRWENNVVQFNFRARGAAAARASCMLLGGSPPFQSRRTCSPFSSANSYKASQSSRAMDAKQPPAPLGDASVAWSFLQGSPRKFVSSKGASSVTSRSSSNRARSVDIVGLALMWWLRCRTRRGWRLVGKRGRTPTLRGGAARGSDLRQPQRSAS